MDTDNVYEYFTRARSVWHPYLFTVRRRLWWIFRNSCAIFQEPRTAFKLIPSIADNVTREVTADAARPADKEAASPTGISVTRTSQAVAINRPGGRVIGDCWTKMAGMSRPYVTNTSSAAINGAMTSQFRSIQQQQRQQHLGALDIFISSALPSVHEKTAKLNERNATRDLCSVDFCNVFD